MVLWIFQTELKLCKKLKVFFCGTVPLFAHFILCYRGMSLTIVDYFMCLGITISRTGIVVFVAIVAIVAIANVLGPVEPKLCYTRLQGNLRANLCLRVEGSCQLRHLLLKAKLMLHLRRSARTIHAQVNRWSSKNPAWVSPNLNPPPPLSDEPSISLALCLCYSLYYTLFYYLTVGLVLVLRHYY